MSSGFPLTAYFPVTSRSQVSQNDLLITPKLREILRVAWSSRCSNNEERM